MSETLSYDLNSVSDLLPLPTSVVVRVWRGGGRLNYSERPQGPIQCGDEIHIDSDKTSRSRIKISIKETYKMDTFNTQTFFPANYSPLEYQRQNNSYNMKVCAVERIRCFLLTSGSRPLQL